jgi:hypothetical protein
MDHLAYKILSLVRDTLGVHEAQEDLVGALGALVTS